MDRTKGLLQRARASARAQGTNQIHRMLDILESLDERLCVVEALLIKDPRLLLGQGPREVPGTAAADRDDRD
jgi:hypothetical protein